MADYEGKKLTELRVIDLKTELERRGLDKTGNKAALLERLAKAIKEDGENPDEYLIVPCGGANKPGPLSKKQIVEPPVVMQEPPPPEPEPEIVIEDPKSNSHDEDKISIVDVEEAVDNEQPEVANESVDEPELSINAHPDDDLELDYGHDPDPEPEEENDEAPMEEDEPQEEEEEAHKEEAPQEEAPQESKQFPHSEESSNVSAVETNGIDNEDSINLTIGEDEENLLGEETESNDRLKDGGNKRTEESDSNSNTSSLSKKGDSKGSGKVESGGGSNKEGTSGSSAAGVKNKDGDGSKSADLASKGAKKDDKDKPTSSSTSTSRNLWVSGLSSTTRATDLKQIFSKYGKVIGAKVVTNARTPGARCYGYVTMSTSDDAEKCIEFLHRTELHGRVISVEKAKGDAQPSHNRKPPPKADGKDEKEKPKENETPDKESADKTETKAKSEDVAKDEVEKKEEKESNGESQERENSVENKEEGSLKDCETRSNKSSSKKSDRDRPSSREDKKRSWDRTRVSRSKSRERPPRRDNVLSFDKIKEERERQRLREKERLLREEKRRRREDMERQRAIDREAARLEREREKLKIEREKIEQEKAELLRLERERQKAEREKLERERERIEMKKQQLRLDESRPTSRGGSHSAALKRPSGDRRETSREAYGEPERKRIASEHPPPRRHSPPERVERRTDVMERISDRRIESSSSMPSRYEGGRSKEMGGIQKPFKRVGEFRNNREEPYHSSGARGGRDGGGMVRRDTRPNPNSMVHRPVKERYDSRPTGGFTREREVHRSDDHRGGPPRDNRYEGSKPTHPRENRYMESSSSGRPTGWQSGPPSSSKPFHSVNSREPQSGWNSRPGDTRGGGNRGWNNSNNMGGHQRSNVYQGGSQHQSYGMSQGGGGGSYERFDQYKGSMQNMRKY